jgi:hypothetical protein
MGGGGSVGRTAVELFQAGVISEYPTNTELVRCVAVNQVFRGFPDGEEQDDRATKKRCHIVLAKCAAIEAAMSRQTIPEQTAPAINRDQTNATIDSIQDFFARAA